jgi:prepilin-type N-terminal cleavage/methylation domain-containing protein
MHNLKTEGRMLMIINSKVKALQRQAGYTLVELSISVAIISVLIVTGLFGVPRILDTNKISTTVQQVSIANANFSKLAAQTGGGGFAYTPTYVTTTSAALAGMGVFPDEAILRNGSIAYGVKHPFNGSIYSKSVGTPITGFLGVDEGYILKLENVPAKNCFAMTSAFGNTAVQISVDGSFTAAPATSAITASAATPEVATGSAGAVIVKNAGQTLNAATLASQCALNPTVVKNIYLWFAY